MNKELLEELIRKVIKEELGKTEQAESEYKQMDKSGVGVVKLNQMRKRVKNGYRKSKRSSYNN